MRFVSSRGQAPDLGFSDALLAGLATDGGLYMPATWPELPDLTGVHGYADIAAAVMSPFVGDDLPPETLLQLSWVLGGLVRGRKALRSPEVRATIRTVHRAGADDGQAGQKVSVGGILPSPR